MRSRRFDPSRVPEPRGCPPFVPPRGPLDLEIGCGVGWHPIRYAMAHPGRTLVALERTRTRFRAFEQRLRNHPPIPNLVALHADAVEWVTHRLGPAALDRVFILYPNPEPGRRNQRWPAMPFLERLAWSMRPGASLTLATNVESYAREAEREMPAFGLRLESVEELRAPRAAPRTHFEKKYLARGETCFNLGFRRDPEPSRDSS